MIRRPASLHAVPRCAGFPRFNGTIRALRLPAVRPAALRFLRPAVPSMRPRRFAPAGPADARACGPGLVEIRPAHAEVCSTETTGPPKFLGNPHCTFAGLFDPGRTIGV